MYTDDMNTPGEWGTVLDPLNMSMPKEGITPLDPGNTSKPKEWKRKKKRKKQLSQCPRGVVASK